VRRRCKIMTTATYLETLTSKPRARIADISRPSTRQELAKIAEGVGEETKRNKTCEACGGESRLGFLIVHHIVPEHVTRQMGITDSSTVGLCISCHSAVHNLYAERVFSMPYDPETKQFRRKLPTEIVGEYKTAYEGFIKHKKGLFNVA